jgi:hypothetical protein
VAAERANSTGALAQFDPEKTGRGMTPPAPAATAGPTVPPASPRHVAPIPDLPRRDPPRRWPPTPIWLGAVAALIALGAWGASRFAGSGSSEMVAASATVAAVVDDSAPVDVPPTAPAPVVLAPSPPPVSAPARVVNASAPVAATEPPLPRRTARPAATPSRALTPARPVEAARTAEVVRQPGFRGSLVVSSEPSGARVMLNGRPVGVTPLALHELPAGSRVVRVEADGYEPWSAAVRVVADQETQVTAALRR